MNGSVTTIALDDPDAAADALQLIGSGIRVGVLDGPDEYVFGRIGGLTRTANGNWAVLDTQSREVRLFDHSGEHRATAGGPGEGPGEFTLPNALATQDPNRIFVSDLRLLRITTLERTVDDLRFVESWQLPGIAPYDICTLGDRGVVHGLELGNHADSDLIHVFDLDLEPIRSFGRIYLSENSIIQSSMSRGRIVCVDPDVIVFVPESLPLVRAFSVSGEPLWDARIEGFVPFPYVEVPDRVENPVPESGAHHNVMVAGPIEGRIILQTAHVTAASQEAGEPYSTLFTFSVDARSGESRFLGTHLPPLVHADGDVAASIETAPYPRFEVYRVERNSRE